MLAFDVSRKEVRIAIICYPGHVLSVAVVISQVSGQYS